MGAVANCSTAANHYKGIKENDDGIVNINNVTAEIEGMLIFAQSVKINGSEYRNQNNAFSRTPLTPKAQKIHLLGHLDTLSLNYIQEMNV